LVEHYDDNTVELYNLSEDIGEQKDRAADFPERVVLMRAALEEWRKANEVQYNTPNPGCDEEAFRRLYVGVDPSRFDPLNADGRQWTMIGEWRREMDAVCRIGR